MTEVIMPKMGDGMEEGTLLQWLKKDGETVASGEVIGTIQTDKATLELESPGKGVLKGVLVQEGQTVPVGEPIAMILKEGESLPASWGSGGAAAPAQAPEPKPEPTPEPVVAAKPEAVSEPTRAEPARDGSRIKASPLARRIAAEAGLELGSIAGSGPGGRIIEKDVREEIGRKGSKIPATIAAPIAATGEDVKVPLNRLRQITAERTQQSKQQAPHFYVTVEVDVEKIMALRDFFQEEESGKVSVNDFVVAACSRALTDMPQVNATYQGDHVLQYGSVHIGIAAAVDDGLLVPVMKNAHALTLRQIADASRDLVQKARGGKLHPDEMSGSTFSISNMGMLNVENFAAIINTPNAAILAISTARRVPVATSEDEIEIRWRMNVTGSFDHRVVDGAQGAQFMNIVRDYLQNPTRLLN